MPSRDIHSRDGGYKVKDLLGSLLVAEKIDSGKGNLLYLVSPWVTDFVLLKNNFGQFRDLFTFEQEVGEQPDILFSQMLCELSHTNPIRIVAGNNADSKNFLNKLRGFTNIESRLIPNEKDHQKGMLTKKFYFEGSMNFTFSGIYLKKEKVTCTTSSDKQGMVKVAEAILEFNRIWENTSPAFD